MALLKCKMCGGDLEITEDVNIAECEYCGTKQTVPVADNEKKLGLFNRANRLRMASEFDKAASVYENIISDFPEEAEAYWGLCLCNYGIEYVDDPATGKKIPTCHRSSFESILDSNDFEMVMENADAVSRKQYRDEAKAIEELRKAILEVSSKEEPYDIFICYKETDEKGDRTIDSVIAQDVYNELTDKGYRVFFSRITLEDKLGQEYEPYIFAALNSAKIMLAFGTDYEYYNAVWVKNEWSRFLQLIARGEKKTLIPCYKNIDAYDMPKEFARLQAQDMGKVGALQDLLRGIEKIIGKKNVGTVVQVQAVSGPNIEALLKRGYMLLEDGEWKKADSYAEKILDINPECAEGYLIKIMVDLKVKNKVDLDNCENNLDNNRNYDRFIEFASDEIKRETDGFIKNVIYKKAYSAMKNAKNEEEFTCIAEIFKTIPDFKDATLLSEKCYQKIEEIKAIKEIQRKRIADSIKKYKIAKKHIATSADHVVGLKSNGKVVAVGKRNQNGECDVDDWVDIIQVAACRGCTFGLKADGTVVTTGTTDWEHNKVENWTDICEIFVNENSIVGLRKDGKVVYVGKNDYNQIEMSEWVDIISVARSLEITAGLKSDGTVVVSGENKKIQYDISNWANIVAVAVDSDIVGLRADGTVVATGREEKEQHIISKWSDIVAVAIDPKCVFGIKSDGTLVTSIDEQCDDWCDTIAIESNRVYTYLVKVDGTVYDIEDGYFMEDVVAFVIGSGFCGIGAIKSDGTVYNAILSYTKTKWKLF